jgi:hypothetical protein
VDDCLSKLILTAIGLGLWANAAVTVVQPKPVAA